MTNATAPEVTAILERHAATLDMLRRAADDGDGAQSLADVVRIRRLGMHTASEPILVCGIVGQAFDAVALQMLADVLPQLEKSDLPLLDGNPVHDFVATPVSYQRAFLGEEACGLATLAGLADGTRGTSTLAALRELSLGPTEQPFDEPLSLLYRCFLLPADITGYRAVMQRYQAVIGSMTQPTPKPYPTIVQSAAEIKEQIKTRRAGAFAALLAPALSGVLESQVKGEALHAAAGVLVAATRARLTSGSLPTTLMPDTIPALPRDPFTADAPLAATRSDTGWVVYSVGPDGEDDGGPQPEGTEAVERNDDVGLTLAAARD